MKIDVLDKGSVELLDHMGDDLAVVDAARVSFAKESAWEKHTCDNCGNEFQSIPAFIETRCEAEGRKCVFTRGILSTADSKLISYLARHNHWTPFSHCYLKFRVKAPIFVRTQLFKHKVGLTENEVSRRYVDTPPEFYEPTEWRARPDKSIKQGSGEPCYPYLEDYYREPEFIGYSSYSERVGEIHEAALDQYNKLLEQNVAPEQARMVLPQSTYTEWIWSGSLSAFARVYKQRTHDTAQLETQRFAKAIGELVEPLFPVSWAALVGDEDA